VPDLPTDPGFRNPIWQICTRGTTVEHPVARVLPMTLLPSEWRQVARAARKALAPTADIRVLDRTFGVVHEARGAWVEHDYPVLRELARETEVIFDVAANIGITALLMADAMVPSGRLYAFEPSPDACRIIRNNAALNGLQSKIRVVDTFVGETSGNLVEFVTDSTSVFNSAVRRVVEGFSPSAVLKTTVAFDDLVRHGTEPPHFVKIDVEGAGLGVLRGMRQCLEQYEPVVFLELHEIPGTPLSEHARLIHEFLVPLGYRMLWLRTQAPLTLHTLKDVTGSRTHFLLLPSGRDVPAWLSRHDTSRL
jgi:FkbM family methyltransferase